MCGLKLQGHDDRWLGGQPQRCQILAFQMKRDRFPEVSDHLVQSGALGHHGDLQTLADIPGLLAGADGSLDRALKHLRSPDRAPV
jgi:hypothetical protein